MPGLMTEVGVAEAAAGIRGAVPRAVVTYRRGG
jgi:hypothetical protein